MLRRRRLQTVEERLHRLERRLDDTEDTVAAALDADRIDDVASSVAELRLTAVTHDDVLDLRVQSTRVSTELARLRAELLAEIDRLQQLVDELDIDEYPRRAAG